MRRVNKIPRYEENETDMRFVFRDWRALFLAVFLWPASLMGAEPIEPVVPTWRVGGELNTFYTDNVSHFSASQRLTLLEDPTQPILDAPSQGRSFVVEPLIQATRSYLPAWGRMDVAIRAQGFIFENNPRFNHGTFGTQLTQALPAETLLRFRYHYGPNMLLGDHLESRLGESRIGAERVTTHFGAIELERKVFDNLVVRLLNRYGTRSYNEPFSQRDTFFWTLGTHMEWEFSPGVTFMLGYHLERGLAKGRKQPEFGEDVSSYIHYVEAEIVARVTDRISIRCGVDFEKTSFTSSLPDDDFRDAHDTTVQGEIEGRYALTQGIDLTLGYLRSQGRLTFERDLTIVNTVWIGSAFRF